MYLSLCLGPIFTSNSGKTVEHGFLESFSKHMKEEQSAWIFHWQITLNECDCFL